MMSEQNLSKIQEFFLKFSPEKQGEAWDELWKSNTTPWDRGSHNPALEDTLKQKRAFLGSPIQELHSDNHVAENDATRRRKKALVPGCGRGFDVFLLAGFGYDSYGLEYSATAVELCKKQAARIEEDIPIYDQDIGKGSVTFFEGDFFKHDWAQKAGVEGSFDLIYDYTVMFCFSFFLALNFCIFSISSSIVLSLCIAKRQKKSS